MTDGKFWMVKGAGEPKVIHSSKQLAMFEAKRLAGNTPGQKFYVLETVGVFEKADVQFTDLSDDKHIPF